ncbi:hypothetical protein NA57DRAFT_77424 [Rhizodiscina lignyota]|uniref:DUF7918 domain-containing protein n=1 Tax=Rhizodiscina lignyota TaxID=1504668 RepID=A0A9P4IDA9_9PEZI|nr:hypothetical protein NA57DRAFT_77424 [Rhizodiscina lignyota]
MKQAGGIEAYIMALPSKKACIEYASLDPDMRAAELIQRNNEVFIEATPGTSYSLWIRITPDFPTYFYGCLMIVAQFDKHTPIKRVIDLDRIREKKGKDCRIPVKTDHITHEVNGAFVTEDLVFGDVPTDGDIWSHGGNVEMEVKDVTAIGRIRVEARRVKLIFNEGSDKPQVVPKPGMQGQPYIFTFWYRTSMALRQLGVIPLTPAISAPESGNGVASNAASVKSEANSQNNNASTVLPTTETNDNDDRSAPSVGNTPVPADVPLERDQTQPLQLSAAADVPVERRQVPPLQDSTRADTPVQRSQALTLPGSASADVPVERRQAPPLLDSVPANVPDERGQAPTLQDSLPAVVPAERSQALTPSHSVPADVPVERSQVLTVPTAGSSHNQPDPEADTRVSRKRPRPSDTNTNTGPEPRRQRRAVEHNVEVNKPQNNNRQVIATPGTRENGARATSTPTVGGSNFEIEDEEDLHRALRLKTLDQDKIILEQQKGRRAQIIEEIGQTNDTLQQRRIDIEKEKVKIYQLFKAKQKAKRAANAQALVFA